MTARPPFEANDLNAIHDLAAPVPTAAQYADARAYLLAHAPDLVEVVLGEDQADQTNSNGIPA